MGLYDDNLKDKIMEDIISDSVTEDKCHRWKRAALIFLGKSYIDDRDNWGFKRIENVAIDSAGITG